MSATLWDILSGKKKPNNQNGMELMLLNFVAVIAYHLSDKYMGVCDKSMVICGQCAMVCF